MFVSLFAWFVAFWTKQKHAMCTKLAVLWDCYQIDSLWMLNEFYDKSNKIHAFRPIHLYRFRDITICKCFYPPSLVWSHRKGVSLVRKVLKFVIQVSGRYMGSQNCGKQCPTRFTEHNGLSWLKWYWTFTSKISRLLYYKTNWTLCRRATFKRCKF